MVALNLGDGPAELGGLEGQLRLCTRRERDGEPVAGRLRLGPWEGAIVSLGAAAG